MNWNTPESIHLKKYTKGWKKKAHINYSDIC